MSHLLIVLDDENAALLFCHCPSVCRPPQGHERSCVCSPSAFPPEKGSLQARGCVNERSNREEVCLCATALGGLKTDQAADRVEKRVAMIGLVEDHRALEVGRDVAGIPRGKE